MGKKEPKIAVLVSWWTKRCGVKDYWLKIDKFLEKNIKTDIIKNTRGPTLNPFYFISLAKKCKKYDLLHVQHNYSLFGSIFNKINSIHAFLFYFLVKFPKGPKIITTMHDIVEPRKLNFIKRAYLDFMNLPLKLFSNKIIVHRNVVRDQLIRQGFKAKNIYVVNYGVDDVKGLLSPKEARRRFGLPERKTVVQFGFVRPDKRYELTINAMTELPDVQLFILGDTPYKNYFKFLKKEISKKGLEKRVIFKDKIPQNMNYAWLSCGDVIVLPYARISASGVLSDAISTHLPIVTSDIPEFKETEKLGVLKTTNVNSETEFAKTISEVIKNPNTTKANILKYIKKNNRNEVAKRTKQIYEEVLSKK